MARILASAAAIYLLGMVVAFGHSAAHSQCDRTLKFTDCNEQAAAPAIGAALFWPLYLSWELQS